MSSVYDLNGLLDELQAPQPTNSITAGLSNDCVSSDSEDSSWSSPVAEDNDEPISFFEPLKLQNKETSLSFLDGTWKSHFQKLVHLHDEVFNFLELPSVVRYNFYDHLLEGAPTVSTLFPESNTGESLVLTRPESSQEAQTAAIVRGFAAVQLSSSCRQLRKELWPLYLRRKCLFIPFSIKTDNRAAVWSYLQPLRHIPSFQLQALNLEFEINLKDDSLYESRRQTQNWTSFMVDYLNRRRDPVNPRRHNHLDSLTLVVTRPIIRSNRPKRYRLSAAVLRRYGEDWKDVRAEIKARSVYYFPWLLFEAGWALKKKFPGYELWAGLFRFREGRVVSEAFMIRLVRGRSTPRSEVRIEYTQDKHDPNRRGNVSIGHEGQKTKRDPALDRPETGTLDPELPAEIATTSGRYLDVGQVDLHSHQIQASEKIRAAHGRDSPLGTAAARSEAGKSLSMKHRIKEIGWKIWARFLHLFGW